MLSLVARAMRVDVHAAYWVFDRVRGRAAATMCVICAAAVIRALHKSAPVRLVPHGGIVT